MPSADHERACELPAADAAVAPTAMLLADPARAAILWALSDGRALAAGELARVARVGLPTASSHLAKLIAGGLLTVDRQGRHRYYRLTDPEPLVTALEALATVSPTVASRSLKESHSANAVRLARTCYDHLAGTLGVSITDALIARGALILNGRGYDVTQSGTDLFHELGIDVSKLADEARRRRRPFTRACLDWSERRYHLAGALGAAMAARLIELAWLERVPVGRALKVTNDGRRHLRKHFDVQAK